MARTLDEVRQAVNELSPEDMAIELGLEMERVDPEIEKAKHCWKEHLKDING